jgi:hypothetical protein
MHEPEIICPNCKHPIKLTESLAAPLIAETQARHNAELLNKELEYSKKADDLRKQQEDLAEARDVLICEGYSLSLSLGMAGFVEHGLMR